MVCEENSKLKLCWVLSSKIGLINIYNELTVDEMIQLKRFR